MFNETRIMGRLTDDPEIRYTDSGKKLAKFSLACDREYKTRDGQELTDFFDCVAWRAKADFVEKYLRKGRLMLVAGRFENSKWTDKEGNKRITTELIVDEFYFTGEPKREKLQGTGEQSFSEEHDDFMELPDNDDDLPF